MTTDVTKRWHDQLEAIDPPVEVRDLLQASLARLSTHHLPTAEHCMRVGMTAAQIGEQACLPVRPLFYAGSLHDLGKIKVETSRLAKTTVWTDSDREALAHHPADGFNELKDRMVVTAGLVVRHHSFQPHPYPEPLPEKPPYMLEVFDKCARVVSLADYYDAAHRTNSAGLTSGVEIRRKITEHNPDQAELINALYNSGVFDTDRRPF